MLMENVDAIDIENIMDRLIHNELSLDNSSYEKCGKSKNAKRKNRKPCTNKENETRKKGVLYWKNMILYLFDGVKTPNNGYQTMVLRFHNDNFKESFLHAYELYKKDSRNKTVGGYMDFLIQYPNTDDAKQIDIVYRSSDLINWNSLDQIKSILSLS